jgi:D-alanyl-lipoteichoic acid acyltransferase DltB (MBOAT superfamily)
VKDVFDHYGLYGANTLLLGALLFTFQIYCDFSGYSDIALGCARLLGFHLMRNFAFPYFSRDISEFWRRWHISLSTWFRDYLYLPMGGSRGGRMLQLRNTFVVFLVSGLWHGANWTFVVWGLINAMYMLPLLLLKRHRAHLNIVAEGRILPSLREFLEICTTFILALIAWVFFRSENIGQALTYLRRMMSSSILRPSHLIQPWLLGLIAVMIVVEWVQRTKHHALEFEHASAWVRRSCYCGVFLMIFFFGRFAHTDFIYFQF